MVPMVSESLQFQIGAQNTLPDLNANAIKRRPAKSRNLPESGNKLGSRAPHSSTSSTRLQPSVQSQNPESTSQKTSGLRNSLQTASKVQNEISLEVDTAYCSKTRKVGNGEHDRRKVGLTSSLKTEGKRTKGILKNKMGIEGKGQKAENDNLVNPIDPVKREHKEARQEHVETNLPSICESKANLSNFEDQVNDLSRYFEVIDLGGDVMIELGGAHEHHGKPFKGERFLRGQQQDSPGMLKPSPHSLPTTVEFTPNTRTPLAEKNSVCNKSGSFGMKIELAQEKPVDKASSTFPSFDNAEKENS